MVIAKKSLGQHFLVDQYLINQLVEAINPNASDNILEIGAGLGALTFPVLKKAGNLTAVEVDGRVLAFLEEKAQSIGKLRLIHKDFRQINLSEINQSPFRIIGNLPYNLSSPILFHCLSQKNQLIDMHFLLQKEVVDRICAQPNQCDYGRLSLMVQIWCEVEKVFEVPSYAFDPPPKVDSAVVRLVVKQKPRFVINDLQAFDLLVKISFQYRRKMIRKSLKNYFSPSDFVDLGIDDNCRAENLSGDDFARLSNLLAKRK